MDFRHFSFVLIFYIVCGTFFSLGFVRPSVTGRRYFLYHGLGCALIATLTQHFLAPTAFHPSLRPYFFTFIAGSVVFSVLIGLQKKLLKVVAILAYLIGLAAALFLIARDTLYVSPPSPAHYLTKTSFVVNAMLSMLLLGFTTACLLIGNWHWLRPKYSFHDLKRMLSLFVLLVLARFAFGTYSLSQAMAGKTDAEIFRYFVSATPGIFLLMRWCWGLMGPLFLSVIVWGPLRVRASGPVASILGITLLCILAGESLSQYLALFHGIPL
jgi:hypothetical protein